MLIERAPLASAGPFSGIPFASRSAVLAAVSGGGDSLALLVLLRRYLSRSAPHVRLVAATVDHGLRPEAAAEARHVSDVCGRLDVEHRTLPWLGAKPAAGLPAAARAARFRLLGEAAEAIGTDLVLTGHTQDDQAETVAMRRRRGEGRGLAGIAPATLHEGRTWFIRPLLGESRAALRVVLEAAAIRWIDDPSNALDRFERARVRKGLDEANIADLAESAALAGRRRIGLGEEAARVIAEVRRVSPGLFRLDPTLIATEAGIYALRILTAAIGGREQLPDASRAAHLCEKLIAGRLRATLSGCVMESGRSGVELWREMRGAGPPPVEARAGALWDGRFRVQAPPDGAALTVGPLGLDLARRHGGAVASGRNAVAALAAQPALRAGGAFLGLAGDDHAAAGLDLRPVVAPWAQLLPSFDIAPARAAAGLLGADRPPDPPCCGHGG